MGVGTIAMSETWVSLLERVPDLGDGRSCDEFPALNRSPVFGYVRGLGLKAYHANELTQDVFYRLMSILPTFALDRRRGRYRTYLWKLTYNTLVDRALRRKARDRAEEEWVRRFSAADESESRRLEEAWIIQHRKRILEVVPPRVRAKVSPTAWACFEARLVHRRPAAEIAAQLGITANAVYAYAHRVLQDLRRRGADIEGEHGDGCDLDLS